MLSSRLRRYLVWSAIGTGLVGIYAAAGFWGVPHLMRSSLQNFVTTHYHRTLTLGEIRFNPFNLRLDMRDVSLPDRDGQPMLGFGRLQVELRFISLWRRAASFRTIELGQPFARLLIRSDGVANVLDLTAPFASDAQQSDSKPKSAPMRLFIDRFAVVAGRATFEDRTHPTPFEAQLQPVSFELRDFSTTGKTGNAYTLSGTSTVGERFSWSGDFGLNPVASHGRFEVTELRARTLWTYLRESLHFEVSSGVIALTGDYDFTAAGDRPDLKVNVHAVTVTDLGLEPRGAAANYVDLKRIEIRDTRLDLARQSVNVGAVSVAGGAVHAWRGADGQVNLLELAGASPAAAHESEAKVTTAAPATVNESHWTVAAPDITVAGLKLAGEDRSVTPQVPFTLDALQLHVAGFSTVPDAQLEITAESPLNGSGKIRATAKFAVQSGALSSNVELAELDLAVFQPYITPHTAVTLLSGRLGAKLAIERDARGALSVKGDTQVTKLRTVDNALKRDFVKWDQLIVAGLQYQSEPASLKIHSIEARAPYARVIIAADRSLNLTQALQPGNQPAVAGVERSAAPAARGKTHAPSAAQPMPMSIGTVRIVNGSANYADLWIQPHFATGIQSLRGTIVGLSSDPRTRAKVNLDGEVDRYAPVKIEGEINLLAATVFSDIKMSFHSMELTTMTPYSGHFAGYKIEKGKLSVDLSYHIENRQLKAEHRFVIDQLQLGDKVDSPDAVSLPLKLAIALLKDRNGVIELSLPVSGTLDDPKFRIGPIIWKAFVGLLVKIATAPFALLGKLVGGGEEMNRVDFDAGSASLDAVAKSRMAALVKSLQERPQLKLDVPISYSPALDTPALAAMQLEDALLAVKAREVGGKKHNDGPVDPGVLADPAEHYRLLVAQYRLELGKDAALPESAQAAEAANKKKGESGTFDAAITDLDAALVARIKIQDTDLEKLGKLRARAVQDALLGTGEIDPSRIFLIAQPPQPAVDKGAAGDESQVIATRGRDKRPKRLEIFAGTQERIKHRFVRARKNRRATIRAYPPVCTPPRSTL